MKCIICKKEEKESVEHIIPEALGNKKLITKRVCNKCNNMLGTNIDDYLTNHFIVKAIREKNDIGNEDKQIKLWAGVETDERTGKKYKIKKDKVIFQPNMFQEQDGSNVIEAASKKDGVAYLKKIMKRKRYSNEYIDKLLKEAVIKEGEEVSSLEFKKEISIDYSRFALAVIKIAYEYAFTKLGETYLDDEVAVLFSNELFQNAYSMRKNNEISDELAKFVIFPNNNDSKWTILTEIKDNISKLNQPVLHNITMLRKDESLYCAVTLCVEPYLSSIIKITQNAGNYKMQMASSYILKNGAVLEIP